MSTTTYQLAFPREFSSANGLHALLALHGSSSVRAAPLRFSIGGRAGGITHWIELPQKRSGLVRSLPVLLPGLRLEPLAPADDDRGGLKFAWRLWQSSSRRPLRMDQPEVVARAVLVALAATRRNEALVLQWTLGPVRRPMSVGSRGIHLHSESWPRALVTAAARPPGELDAEARDALRSKRALPAWRLVGHIAVRAASRQRAQQLAAGLLAALRSAEAPGVRLGVHRSQVARLASQPWRWNLEANVAELLGLLALPVEHAGQGLPVAIQRARLLEPVASSPKNGKTLGTSADGRPLRLGDNDSRRNLLISGPIGVGKSNLLLQLILQDIARGQGVVLIDPKGDLVEDVLARFPEQRRADLVIIDPKDAAPVGLNPLHKPADPALAADQVLSVLRDIFKDLGPRTTDLLSAALLTLARWGEGSLATLPLLLSNAGLRRRIVGSHRDPLGTGPVWAWFEQLSAAERQQILAPGLNKVRPFVVRPDLRAVFGQLEPRFDLGAVVRGRPVILVNTAKGLLGPTSSSLLGTLVLSQIWQQLQRRASLPIGARKHLSVYVDELADYLRLPGDIGEILIMGRSLKASFVLAHQHLGQLGDLRPAVLANTRSKVTFAVSQEDARVFAQGHPELDALDITSQPSFTAYASLLTHNEPQPYATLRTAAPPRPMSDPAELRAAVRAKYGRSRADTDAALEALIDPAPERPSGAPGSRPRRAP